MLTRQCYVFDVYSRLMGILGAFRTWTITPNFIHHVYSKVGNVDSNTDKGMMMHVYSLVQPLPVPRMVYLITI